MILFCFALLQVVQLQIENKDKLSSINFFSFNCLIFIQLSARGPLVTYFQFRRSHFNTVMVIVCRETSPSLCLSFQSQRASVCSLKKYASDVKRLARVAKTTQRRVVFMVASVAQISRNLKTESENRKADVSNIRPC